MHQKWKLISRNTYGVVYRTTKEIIKIIPESQKKEVLFWQRFHTGPGFIKPRRIVCKRFTDRNPYGIPCGTYYLLYMPIGGRTLADDLKKKKISANFLPHVFRLLERLYEQEFVHGDVHFENILRRRNEFFLIDFGLVLHPEFCATKYERDLHKLYHWAKEDFFTLLLKTLFYEHEHLLISDSNYAPIRKQWIYFFLRHPKDWHVCKILLEKLFDFGRHEDYYFCFQYFIKHLLTTSKHLSPRPGIQLYDMLIKIFLDRTFLICSIYYPHLIKLPLHKTAQKEFQKTFHKYFIDNPVIK